MITFDEFKKIEIKIGEVVSVEKVPDTDKLLKLFVDFGFKQIEVEQVLGDNLADKNKTSAFGEEKDIRQIISGIALYYEDIQELVGKKLAFVTNLEPRKIKGLESQGMVLGLHNEKDESVFALLTPTKDVPSGSAAV